MVVTYTGFSLALAGSGATLHRRTKEEGGAGRFRHDVTPTPALQRRRNHLPPASAWIQHPWSSVSPLSHLRTWADPSFHLHQKGLHRRVHQSWPRAPVLRP